MAVRFTSRIKQWTAETETKLDIAVFKVITDVDRVAKINAPKDKRALINSSRIVGHHSGSYSVIYGGGKVPYARIQEKGGTINPKKHEYLSWKDKDGNWHRAKSVTIKALHYLERAGDDTSRNVKRYFKGL